MIDLGTNTEIVESSWVSKKGYDYMYHIRATAVCLPIQSGFFVLTQRNIEN